MIKLTVVTADFGAAANIGGNVQTTARTFDLPPEVADYIKSQMGEWTTVTLAIDKGEPA